MPSRDATGQRTAAHIDQLTHDAEGLSVLIELLLLVGPTALVGFRADGEIEKGYPVLADPADRFSEQKTTRRVRPIILEIAALNESIEPAAPDKPEDAGNHAIADHERTCVGYAVPSC